MFRCWEFIGLVGFTSGPLLRQSFKINECCCWMSVMTMFKMAMSGVACFRMHEDWRRRGRRHFLAGHAEIDGGVHHVVFFPRYYSAGANAAVGGFV